MTEPERMNQNDEGAVALVKTLRLGFVCLRLLIVLLVLAYFYQGFFAVNSNEVAIVLRFGQIVGKGEDALVKTGYWNWAWPKPVSKIVRLEVKTQKEVRIDKQFWYNEEGKSKGEEQLSESMPLTLNSDYYLLTGDSNILHTKWVVNYMITDPITYYTHYEAEGDRQLAEKAVRCAVENAILKAFAGVSVSSVLRQEAKAMEERVSRMAAENVEKMELGVMIQGAYCVEKTPPRGTMLAFREVTNAESMKSTKENEALQYARTRRMEARGTAARMIAEAGAYKEQVVKSIQADAKRFREINEAYQKWPEATLLTVYKDVLREVYSNSKERYILPHAAAGEDRELRIMISEEPPNRKPAPKQ